MFRRVSKRKVLRLPSALSMLQNGVVQHRESLNVFLSDMLLYFTEKLTRVNIVVTDFVLHMYWPLH